MGVTSEILGNAGAAHVLEHNGKVFKVRLIDQAVKSAFEKRMYERAKHGLIELRDAMTKDEYFARLRELGDNYEAGEYELLSERGLKFIQTTQGVKFLLALLLDCSEEELFSLLTSKGKEITSLINLVIRESFPGLEVAPEGGETKADVSKESSAAVPN